MFFEVFENKKITCYTVNLDTVNCFDNLIEIIN